MEELFMFKEIVVIVGGACIGIALGRYLYKKYYSVGTSGEKVDIESLCDDECVVDEVTASTLTGWFKANNADNVFENVVILPTKKNMDLYKITNFVKDIPQNSLFQIIYDDKKDAIQRFRLINYGTIQKKLNDILEEADGVLIIGERE